MAGLPTIQDLAANALTSTTGTTSSSASVTVDHTAPTVTAASLVGNATTKATSVDFLVTFSEAVQTPTAAMFEAVASSGITGTIMVGTPATTATPNQYKITLSGFSGDGTLGLRVLTTIKDATGNALVSPFTTPSYTIDTTKPTLSSITPSTAGPVSSGNVSFTVVFSETVTDVADADFAVTNGAITSVSGSGTTYIVTVSTTSSTTGDLTLALVTTGTTQAVVTDVAGNTLDTTLAANQAVATVAVDKAAPTATFALVGPATTNASQVQFTVTFSEPVTGVTADDFGLTFASPVSGATVLSVTGSGQNYVVTVATGSGDGSIALTINTGTDVKDAAGNPAVAATTNGSASVAIDKTRPAPTFGSVTTDPTNSPSVTFNVSFLEVVTGLTASDFVLTGSVQGTISLDNATPATPDGKNYVVTVSDIAPGATGTLGVRLAAGSAFDAAGNSNTSATSGQYTIDRVAPTSALTTSATGPTKATQVTFTLTLSEAATQSLTSADFDLTGGSLASASIAPNSGGFTYTIVVNTGFPGSTGTLSLQYIGTTAKDAAGNSAMASNTVMLAIDKQVPTVTEILGGSATPTNASSVEYLVTFSEAVLNVGTNDFTLGANPTGSTIDAVTQVGTTNQYRVTILTGATDGTIALAFASPVTVNDAAINPLNTTLPAGGFGTYTVDKTKPVVSFDPVSTTPIKDATVTFTVTYTGADLASVAISDFEVVGTGLTGTPTLAFGLGGTDKTKVIVSGIDTSLVASGTVALRAKAGSVLDKAGNSNLEATSGAFTIDQKAPSATLTAPSGPTKVSPVVFMLTFSEGVTAVPTFADFLVNNVRATQQNVTVLAVSGGYSVTVTPAADGALTLAFDNASGSVKDAATNAATASNTASVVVDTTKPSATISLFSADITGGTNQSNKSQVRFEVLFAEAVAGLSTASFTLATGTGSSTTASIASVVRDGTTNRYVVTVDAGSGNGTVKLDLNAAAVSDAAGNTNAATAGPSYSINQTKPYVISIDRTASAAALTNAPSVSYTVKFSEAVTGVDATDFVLSETVTGAMIDPVVMGSGDTWTVTVNTGSGDGTITLRLADNDSIIDAAGNMLAALSGSPDGSFTGQSYTIDKTSPLTTIVLDQAATNNLATVTFTVTFAEVVTGIYEGIDPAQIAADFALSGTSTTSAFTKVEAIGTDGKTFRVSVTTGTGSGTIILSAKAGAGTDPVGNPTLAGTSPTYTIDHAAPTVSTIAVNPADVTGASATTNDTNKPSVRFDVTFSEDVTGIDAADFVAVDGAGIALSGYSISGVTGSGTAYTVTVSIPATANGQAVYLKVLAAAGQDAATNGSAGATSTAFYTADRVAPTATVTSTFTRTNADTVTFGVTFGETPAGTLGGANFQAFLDGAPLSNVTVTYNAGVVTVTGAGIQKRRRRAVAGPRQRPGRGRQRGGRQPRRGDDHPRQHRPDRDGHDDLHPADQRRHGLVDRHLLRGDDRPGRVELRGPTRQRPG